MLASSLTSVKAGNNVISMKIKLTDKVSPCITLELELVSNIDAVITYLHRLSHYNLIILNITGVSRFSSTNLYS